MKAPIGKVFRYCSTSKGDPLDCVKWAEAALCEEFDTPSLRILAGLSDPLNFFEVKSYTEAALNELGIKITLKEELMEHQPEMIISSELDPGEKLIWSGIPRQGILFRGSDILMIPFSLLWGGFAIFWEIMALHIPAKEAGPIAIIFPLFGIPFVIVGLYMIFGRFIFDSKNRSNTYYGVTDQRIIIKSGLFKKNVKSLNLRTLTDISLNEKSGGDGSITFGQENPMASWFGGAAFPGRGYNVPKFEMISNAKDVYNKIREIQKKS